MTTTLERATGAVSEPWIATPVGAIQRDIARGGLAGAIVGLVGGGIGGLIVMSLAAVLVPESAGAWTENGNPIGQITLAGTLGIALFGLIAGVMAATLWVMVSPWLGEGLRRFVLVVPIAIGLGTRALIAGENPDFIILRHNPAVIGLLIALVGVIGLLFAVVDAWLDRVLPAGAGRAGAAYAVMASIGAALIGPLVIFSLLDASEPPTRVLGVVIAALAAATVGVWIGRIKGLPQPAWLTLSGRAALFLAVAIGFAGLVPEVSLALGLS